MTPCSTHARTPTRTHLDRTEDPEDANGAGHLPSIAQLPLTLPVAKRPCCEVNSGRLSGHTAEAPSKPECAKFVKEQPVTQIATIARADC
jgi:hypothetical protein